MQEFAKEYHTSISNVARIAVRNGLDKYLSTLRYIDSNQGARIESIVNDLSYTCRNILNNVRRIGINYNQEIKLKKAENKYREVMKKSGASINELYAAKDELDAARDEIKKTCLDKDELNNLLTRFENAAERIEEIICLIRS